MSEGAERIMEMGLAFRAAKALLSADELGLFTALAQTGPLDGEALRIHLGIHERGARDFFDVLVALGMLRRDRAGRYSNGEGADEFLDQNKDSYVGGFLKQCNSLAYSSWAGLTEALRTGAPNPGFKSTDIGERHDFDALYEDPGRLEGFLKAMTGAGLLPARALAARFPWHNHQVVLDVGCAEGGFLVQLAQAHAHITGIGFDLPVARPWFENCTKRHTIFCPGFGFSLANSRDPYSAADTVVFGRVLHNWNLSTKKLLLTKAYEALPYKGEIIIYERLIDDDRRTNANALLSSLHMLLMTSGGFDFSAAECMNWLREAGFRDAHSEVLTASHSFVVGTNEPGNSTKKTPIRSRPGGGIRMHRLVLIITATALLGCSGQNGRQPLREVRVGLSIDGITWLPVRLAQTMGYTAQEGINLSISEFNGLSKATEALLGQSVDVTTGGLSLAIQVAAAGRDVRCFVMLYQTGRL